MPYLICLVFLVSRLDGRRKSFGDQFLISIDSCFERLKKTLTDIPGVQIEHNKFTISVHFRNVNTCLVAAVESAIDAVIVQSSGKLQKRHGKMVFEIRPILSWDKVLYK